MNWKDLYTEATAKEREQILRLLAQRIQARAENLKIEHSSIRARLKRVVMYWRGKIIWPRGSAHWIGSRRRRLERPATILLFLTAMTILEPREYAVWAAIFGGFTALTFPFLFFHYQFMRVLNDVDVEDPRSHGR